MKTEQKYQDLASVIFIGLVKKEMKNTGCTVGDAKKNIMKFMKSEKFLSVLKNGIELIK